MRQFEISEQRRQDLIREAENYRLAKIARSAQQRGRYVGLRQLPERLWALRWRVTPVMLQVQRRVDLHNHKTEELPAVRYYSR